MFGGSWRGGMVGDSLNVSSKWMFSRKELSMFVKRRILAPFYQPNELQSCLACWAWELTHGNAAAATMWPSRSRSSGAVALIRGRRRRGIPRAEEMGSDYFSFSSLELELKKQRAGIDGGVVWFCKNYRAHTF